MSDPTPINRFTPFDPVRVREIIRAFDEHEKAQPPRAQQGPGPA